MNNEEKDILEIKEEEQGDTLTPSEMVEENQEQPIHEEIEEEVVKEDNLPTETNALDNNIEESLDEQPIEEEAPKMFDQAYVNDLVGKTRMEAREKAMRAMYDKYGVEDEATLDSIFGKGQSYDILNDNYNNVNTRLSDVMAENALLKSKTDESRWDDIRLILKGKGLDITPENIATELTTHPEWMQGLVQSEQGMSNVLTPDNAEQIVNNPNANVDKKPSAQIKRFGSDVPPTEDTNEEENFMSKYFRI